MENDNSKVCWDPTLLLGKTVSNNLPYIRQFDAINRKTAFTDIAIPLIRNLQATNAEKQYKYQTMDFETSKQWKQNGTFFTPSVLPAVRVITDMLNKV